MANGLVGMEGGEQHDREGLGGIRRYFLVIFQYPSDTCTFRAIGTLAGLYVHFALLRHMNTNLGSYTRLQSYLDGAL